MAFLVKQCWFKSNIQRHEINEPSTREVSVLMSVSFTLLWINNLHPWTARNINTIHDYTRIQQDMSLLNQEQKLAVKKSYFRMKLNFYWCSACVRVYVCTPTLWILINGVVETKMMGKTMIVQWIGPQGPFNFSVKKLLSHCVCVAYKNHSTFFFFFLLVLALYYAHFSPTSFHSFHI